MGDKEPVRGAKLQVWNCDDMVGKKFSKTYTSGNKFNLEFDNSGMCVVGNDKGFGDGSSVLPVRVQEERLHAAVQHGSQRQERPPFILGRERLLVPHRPWHPRGRQGRGEEVHVRLGRIPEVGLRIGGGDLATAFGVKARSSPLSRPHILSPANKESS